MRRFVQNYAARTAAVSFWRNAAILRHARASSSSSTISLIGLECFESSGPPLFDGSKDLSVREFPLPAECTAQPILLLARADPPGSEPLPDELLPEAGRFHIAGMVKFSSGAQPYESRAAFEADTAGHHMASGGALYLKYAGEPGGPWPGPLGEVYPWQVAAASEAPQRLTRAPSPAVKRRLGPLFDVQLPRDMIDGWPALASELQHGKAQPLRTTAAAAAPEVADAPHTAQLRATLSRKRKLSTDTTVHILDFSAFRSMSADASARSALAAQLFASMRDIGFAVLTNHGLPQHLTDRAWDEAANFFALPSEVKKRSAFGSPEANRGYLGVEEEKADFRVPDLRETINIGDEHDAFDNPWPDEAALPEFREAMLQFYDASDALHLDVLRCLAVGMGLDEEHFTHLCNGLCNTLRLLHYPSCKRTQLSDDVDGQKRAGAHTDLGTITLLHQRGGGLYVCDRHGEWVFVPPLEGSIIVNVGDVMMRWSNNVLRSTPHCVMDDPRITGDEVPPRFSMAYFCNPNRDTLIECLPTCTSTARPPAYPPVRAGDYLIERVAALVG